MQIISINVGIKNLAYCIIDIDTLTNNEYKIIKWDSINLCGEDMKCLVQTEKGTLCNKKATYSKNNIDYCLIHAKKTSYMVPNKELSVPSIKKMNINNLISLAEKYHIHLNDDNKKKDKILKTILDYKSLHAFEIIGKKSPKQLGLVNYGVVTEKEE